MLIVGLCAWLTAFILYYKNKVDSIKWLAHFAFLAGCGAFANVLAMDLAPYIERNVTNSLPFVNDVKVASGILHSISYSGSPYTFLIFAISYTGIIHFKSAIQKKLIYALLFLPVLVMFVLYPVFYFSHRAFILLNTWVDPYVLLGSLLLLWAYINEKELRRKQERLLVFITVSPAVLFLLVTVYVCPVLGEYEAYRYNILIISSTILLYLFAVRYGFLGFKLTFHKYYLDNTMKVVSSGTSLLNHTLKNEIAKIKLCLREVSTEHNLEADDNIQIINASAEHILRMISRIHEKTQEIILILQDKELSQIIDAALLQSKPLLDSKNIEVKNNCKSNAVVLCDEIHLREVIYNLIHNSVEAMKDDGGVLNINAYKNKKELIVEISDNGSGIKKEILPHLFEPFLTTKNCQSNYGLGLTYCYKVMKEHKGSIEVISEEGKGATVLLKFPLSKVSNQKSESRMA